MEYVVFMSQGMAGLAVLQQKATHTKMLYQHTKVEMQRDGVVQVVLLIVKNSICQKLSLGTYEALTITLIVNELRIVVRSFISFRITIC